MSSSESDESSQSKKAPVTPSPYKCPLCELSSTSLPAILKHIRTHSKDNPWNCEGCEDGFIEEEACAHSSSCPESWESEETPLEDFEISEDNAVHRCTLCPFTSDRLYELVDHIHLHVRKRQDANELLDGNFSQVNRDNIYTCTVCEFSCVRPNKLEAHMALHAPGATLECKHCGIAATSLKELRKHQKTHELDRPFVCPVCSARFTRVDNMKLHLKSHDGDTQYYCRFCNYVTTNKARVHQHYQNHRKNGQKTATSTKASVDCPVCGQGFVSYPLLMFHIRAHATRPPFRCPPCQTSFNSGDEAEEHFAEHVESFTLSCAYCNFKCFDDSTIHNHLGSHHGSHKPFQCEVCDFRFATFQHWKRHQLVHSGEKPFECEICGARFCASGNRKAHMIKLHGYYIPIPRGKQRKLLQGSPATLQNRVLQMPEDEEAAWVNS